MWIFVHARVLWFYLSASAEGGGEGGESIKTNREEGMCVYKCERDYLMKKKTVIKGRRQTKEGEQRKGEGSLKGHHLTCSKWQ